MDLKRKQTMKAVVVSLGLLALSGAVFADEECQGVHITISELPSVIPADLPFNANVGASGGVGPYTFSGGNGITLVVNSGGHVNMEHPCPGGDYLGFSIGVQDANGCQGSKSYCILMQGCCPITLYGGTGVGVLGQAFDQQVGCFNGNAPYTYAMTGGALPPGLALTGYGSYAGEIKGTPTATGDYAFTVMATDSVGCTGSADFSIHVACYGGITLSPSTLPGGSPGSSYSQTVTASGGTGPYTYAIGNVGNPPRLAISPGGVITGTLLPGIYDFWVTATDANGCAGNKEYHFNVGCPQPPLTIDPPSVPPGEVGVHYELTFTQTGGVEPITWDYAHEMPLPDGMSFADGALWGAPTQMGSFPLEIYATDAYHCFALRDVTLVIGACPAISLSPPLLPNGTLGGAYGQSITAVGGTPGYTYSVTAGWLPGGISLSPSGVLSGTSTTRGTFTFKATAVDAAGCTGNAQYNLTINSGDSTPIETAPGNTRDTAQTWIGKESQTWLPNPQATSYKVYRGQRSNLPDLLGSDGDSCLRYAGTANSANTADDPSILAAGDFFWYLVAGVNGYGEGYAGNALVGGQMTPRFASGSGVCP